MSTSVYMYGLGEMVAVADSKPPVGLFSFATEAAEAAAPPLAGAARAVPYMATVVERTWMTVSALLKIWVRTVRSCIVGYGSVWILGFWFLLNK